MKNFSSGWSKSAAVREVFMSLGRSFFIYFIFRGHVLLSASHDFKAKILFAGGHEICMRYEHGLLLSKSCSDSTPSHSWWAITPSWPHFYFFFWELRSIVTPECPSDFSKLFGKDSWFTRLMWVLGAPIPATENKHRQTSKPGRWESWKKNLCRFPYLYSLYPNTT